MAVDPTVSPERRRHEGRNYSFCAKGCADAFDADPARYALGRATSAGP